MPFRSIYNTREELELGKVYKFIDPSTDRPTSGVGRVEVEMLDNKRRYYFTGIFDSTYEIHPEPEARFVEFNWSGKL